MKKIALFSLLPAIFLSPLLLANNPGTFCHDPDALALTDRGSVTDTPCVVPSKKVLIEGGYLYQNLIGARHLSTYPVIQYNLGLPGDTEVFIIVPSYNRAGPNLTGLSATNLGAKIELASRKDWTISGAGNVTLPTGSANFGSDGGGVTINAIGAYSLTSKVTLSSMLGYSSLVEPANSGGERFNSFNYSVNLGYELIEKISFFTEIFGQTKANPEQNNGLNADLGMLFVWNKHVVFDVEYSQRLQGAIGGWENYVGGGVTILLG